MFPNYGYSTWDLKPERGRVWVAAILSGRRGWEAGGGQGALCAREAPSLAVLSQRPAAWRPG